MVYHKISAESDEVSPLGHIPLLAASHKCKHLCSGPRHNVVLSRVRIIGVSMKGFITIPEFPEYSVSETGEVFSSKSNRLLKIQRNSNGYPYVTFTYHYKRYQILIHRLLAYMFKDLPSLDSELEVDHDNRDVLDFTLDNLVVMTKEQHRQKTTLERGHTIGGTKCTICSIKISSGRVYCASCSPAKKITSPEISPESIEYWVSNYSWVRAAKELGLSDNGLRKRYKSLTGKDPKTIKKPS